MEVTLRRSLTETKELAARVRRGHSQHFREHDKLSTTLNDTSQIANRRRPGSFCFVVGLETCAVENCRPSTGCDAALPSLP